jgi:cell division protein FtsL
MSRTYYVNGSAVRELETQPLRRPERPDRRKIEEEQRKKRRRNAARRNRERELGMSKGYVIFLSACVAAVAVCAVNLIQMQSQVSQRMKNIAAMESQLTDMKADNDARYKEIVTSVDLEYIKDVAINQLGMNYATAEQLIYFTVDNQNFMDQYGDIPE